MNRCFSRFISISNLLIYKGLRFLTLLGMTLLIINQSFLNIQVSARGAKDKALRVA